MISRRRFLTLAGAGTAGLGLNNSAHGLGRSSIIEEAQTAAPTPPRVREFRPLGTTGLKISDVGCGAINLFNPNVLRYAYECGVNHFDTAEGYLNTNSEKMIGQTLGDVRDKVVITTKYQIRTPADIDAASLLGRVEASLKRLRTDFIDIVLVHAVDVPERLDDEKLQSAFVRVKKEGKARFIGFSTHVPALMLEKAIASGPWEVVLMTYNHMESAAAEPLIVRAREKGVGLIAMKILAGGMQGSLKPLVNDKLRYSQAAIRWVTGNPRIDACTISMSTFSHVEEYVAASGMPLKREDVKLLARYRKEAGPAYCRVSCRECLASCPRNVAVNDVLRYAMYFEHYGMEKNAVQLYGELEDGRKPLDCGSCSAPCQGACPYGLQVRERLLRSHVLLA